MSKIERPEALAQFAESARRGERAGVAGLTATKATAPLRTDPRSKDEAATRVLAEGATGEDLSAEEYVNRVPDRILESQARSGAAAPESGKLPDPPYDASRDPRTGRPPLPDEAHRLAQEHELRRLSDQQPASEGEQSGDDASENADEDNEESHDDETMEERGKMPARMVSPASDDGDVAAVENDSDPHDEMKGE